MMSKDDEEGSVVGVFVIDSGDLFKEATAIELIVESRYERHRKRSFWQLRTTTVDAIRVCVERTI